MAALTTPDRQAIVAELQRDLSRVRESLDVNKADLLAAINATDDWIDANAGSFNAALPLPARTALTAKQKTQLFMHVAARRYGVL